MNAEIIITLPTGEVICRQIERPLNIPKTHCKSLAIQRFKKKEEKQILSEIKIEIIL